jgi:hypothetical protein
MNPTRDSTPNFHLSRIPLVFLETSESVVANANSLSPLDLVELIPHILEILVQSERLIVSSRWALSALYYPLTHHWK